MPNLTVFFKRIYEDEIHSVISHEGFLKLSAEYETEQKERTEFVKTEQAAVDTCELDRTDFDSFAAVIRKYVGIRELTHTIVNEFVKKILSMCRTNPAAIAGKKLNWSGTSSEKSTCRATIRPWNGKEKAGRHDLSAMPPCDNKITSL